MITLLEESNTTLFSQGFYLGPARVGEVGRDRMLLVFPDQKVWATLALAVPYRPAPGDKVLAIAQHNQWYVIGVLEGTGVTSITVPGNLELHAPHGEIRLNSACGVRIKSSLVEIATKKLDLTADRVVEKFQRVRRSVAGAYEITAGSLKAVVQKTLRLKGNRIVQRAKADVKIDGQQVRLG